MQIKQIGDKTISSKYKNINLTEWKCINTHSLLNLINKKGTLWKRKLLTRIIYWAGYENIINQLSLHCVLHIQTLLYIHNKWSPLQSHLLTFGVVFCRCGWRHRAGWKTPPVEQKHFRTPSVNAKCVQKGFCCTDGEFVCVGELEGRWGVGWDPGGGGGAEATVRLWIFPGRLTPSFTWWDSSHIPARPLVSTAGWWWGAAAECQEY